MGCTVAWTMLSAPLVLSLALLGSSPYAVIKGPSGTVKAPLFSEKYAKRPIAKIGEEVITLEELSDALASAHEGRSTAAEAKPAKKDFRPVLDRLIGVKLIIREAREMGLEELPEVKEAFAKNDEAMLRETLKELVTVGVKPDPAEVDRLYKDAVREWKVRSAHFAKKEDAEAMGGALKAGKDFEELAKAAIAAKKAAGNDSGWVSGKTQLLPQVAGAIRALKVGEASPVVAVDKGFAIVKLEEIRYPDDKAARAQAEAQSLKRLKLAALKRYYDGLLKKYAKIDDKLLASIDFEAPEPGFDALLKDERILVQVSGDAPITVGDLAKGLQASYFHGIDEAIRQKRLNKEKASILDGLLSKKLVAAEAKRDGIADSASYKKAVTEFREQTLFSLFIERAVMPELKISEDDLKKYYGAHKSEFARPAFYTLASLGFASPKDAQAAFDKLKAGTDFKWLEQNAPGQLAEGERAIDFAGGSTVSASTMPADLAKALAGAKAGAVKLYKPSGGRFYVLQVKAVTPASAQPFEQAKGDIVPKVRGEKLNKAVADWTRRLRKARDVKVYVTQIRT